MTPTAILARTSAQAQAATDKNRAASESPSGNGADFQAALARKMEAKDAQRPSAEHTAKRAKDKPEPDSSDQAQAAPTEPPAYDPSQDAPQSAIPAEQVWAMLAASLGNSAAGPGAVGEEGASSATGDPMPGEGGLLLNGKPGSLGPIAPGAQQPVATLASATQAGFAPQTSGAIAGGAFAAALSSAEQSAAAGPKQPDPVAALDGSLPTERNAAQMAALPWSDVPSTAAPRAAAPAELAQNVSTPMGQQAWGDDLGERILWLAQREVSSAQLRLNPEHLGPVNVDIRVDGEGTSIQFTAHSASVREAIEAAVPKLREMFGAQQLPLTEVAVTAPPPSAQAGTQGFDAHGFQGQPGSGQPGTGSGSAFGAGAGEEAIAEPVVSGRAGMGLVNLFA
jgi:flagellar hook-length control protein FliK